MTDGCSWQLYFTIILPPKSLKTSWVPSEHFGKIMRGRPKVPHVSDVISVWQSPASRSVERLSTKVHAHCSYMAEGLKYLIAWPCNRLISESRMNTAF